MKYKTPIDYLVATLTAPAGAAELMAKQLVKGCCLAVLLALGSMGSAEEPTGATSKVIAETEIAVLQKKLAEAGEDSSSIRKRRAYKNVVREGKDLLEAALTAPNRWQVLEIMFQSQKRLLGLENSDSNREALLETCAKLAEAPDDLADLRLEADLLLSEASLSARNAGIDERARALGELLGRYRDTPGEAKSLMMASQIAPKLEAFALEAEIERAMAERFADHHGVIEFRRKLRSVRSMDVLFNGTYSRTDGTALSFPVDRMGHQCIMVFWSRETQGFETALKQINGNRDLFPDQFEFYSFNLDELPDGGEATLRGLELDWTVMRLPGGKQSQAYRTYGQRDPVSIMVNAYGHAILTSSTSWGRGQLASQNPYLIEDERVSDERYLAQLQSLFIGDFLVTDTDAPPGRTPESVPPEVINPILSCFTLPPLRYRLTHDEALTNYQTAEKLAREAIARHPQAPDLWRVRNCRIIALLGMWNLSGEPKHLAEAVNESRLAMATTLPPGADVAARFCLAKDALRRNDADAKSVLAALIEGTGGSEAPGSAVAAAAILALDAHSRDLHEHYREELLERHAANPLVWPVASFLRDRYFRFHLLQGNFSRGDISRDQRSSRAHIINHGLEPMTDRLPRIELKTLDGGTLTLPDDSAENLTLLMFVEPPADSNAGFPHAIGGTPADGRKAATPGVMQWAFERADLHVRKEVKVIAAFLCDDAERVRGLMEKNAWPCQAALVPGGLGNPLVRQLGILSADRMPNIFLLRRDGTIAWSTSGFFYKTEFGYPFAIFLAMKLHIEVCDTEAAYQALAQGDFQKAKDFFSGPFPPEKDERFEWAGPRFHGRALANVGLKDWGAALADIDAAIETHSKGVNHATEKPCSSMIGMQFTKAAILDKLGRTDEARAARDSAATPPGKYPTTIYDSFHDRLKHLPVLQR